MRGKEESSSLFTEEETEAWSGSVASTGSQRELHFYPTQPEPKGQSQANLHPSGDTGKVGDVIYTQGLLGTSLTVALAPEPVFACLQGGGSRFIRNAIRNPRDM